MEENQNKEEILEELKNEGVVTPENNVVQENNQEEKKGVIEWAKSHLPVVIVAAVALIALILIVVLSFSSGPKSAVKDFTSAFSKLNAKKLVNSMDLVGASVWSYYDGDDFSKDDYNDFIDDYKEEKKDIDLSEEKEEWIEDLEEGFEEVEDEVKNFKIKIEKFKDVEKLGKNLYAVEARINLIAKAKDSDDDLDEVKDVVFIVYKNKIIYTDLLYALY